MGVWNDRTGEDGFKLTQGRVRVDVRNKFLTVMIVRPRHKLPREAVVAPGVGGRHPSPWQELDLDDI